MLALIGSAMALAPMIGPILGGAVQVLFGWRWNFGILASFGLATLVLAWIGLAESNDRRDPAALAPARMAANFGTLLRHRGFLGFALSVAFSYAGLFAFISGSSFVLIDGLGVRGDGGHTLEEHIVIASMPERGRLLAGLLARLR